MEEVTSKTSCRKQRVIKFILILVLGYLVLALSPIRGFDFFYHIGFGWLFHLRHNLGQIHWNIGTLLLSIGAAAGAIALLHRMLRPHWSIRQTTTVSAIFLTTCAAAIAMTGIIHQLAWLARSPVFVRRGMPSHRMMALFHGKQIALRMLELSSEDIYPSSIEELTHKYPLNPDIFTFQPVPGSQIRERFILLTPGQDFTQLPAETPILAAFLTDRVVFIQADSAGKTATIRDFQKILELRHARDEIKNK